MVGKNADVDFIIKNLDNVRVFKINSLPAIQKHLTAKYHVDEAIA